VRGLMASAAWADPFTNLDDPARARAPSVRARRRVRATFRATPMIGSPENHATRGNGTTFWVRFWADVLSTWRLAARPIPVATTDTRTASARAGSKVAPRMMLASSSTSWRMRLAASSTS
jgi:hypothetical protein